MSPPPLYMECLIIFHVTPPSPIFIMILKEILLLEAFSNHFLHLFLPLHCHAFRIKRKKESRSHELRGAKPRTIGFDA
jgi:hypothetical protein